MNSWRRIVLVSALFVMLLEPTVLATGYSDANINELKGQIGSASFLHQIIDKTSRICTISNGDEGIIAFPDNTPGPLVSGSGPSVSGIPIFPSDHIWNTRADTLPVSPLSAEYVRIIGSAANAHADFGSGLYEGSPIGIPYNIVNGSLPKKTILFEYADESDSGPYPVPDYPLIEGGSDHHLLIIDRDTKMLYELFAAEKLADGSWVAGSGAVFNLSDYTLRPSGWTSADAAGLAILPGLVKYDEINAGEINHALRFTAPSTGRAYIWPARHYASSITDPSYPPMGQRFRLKSSFNTSGYPPQTRVVLDALKKYGIILSDNGAPWYISGVPDDRWDNDDLHTLHQLKGSDFEAVDSSSLIINQNSGKALATSVISNLPARIGIFRNGTWYLNYNSDSLYEKRFKFGTTGDVPLVGDWQGTGRDGIAIFRPSTGYWYFDNNLDGVVDKSFRYGGSTDQIIKGDWQGAGRDGIAIFRPSTGYWYFDYNLDGVVDKSFRYGGSTDIVIVGRWT
jgi:hypothetical protein